MNRIITALALSGLFVAAPAFARVNHQGRKAPVAQKASAGEKTTGSADKANTDTKSETVKGEAAPTDASAKPAKKSKHKKSAKAAEGASTEKPAEAPAK